MLVCVLAVIKVGSFHLLDPVTLRMNDDTPSKDTGQKLWTRVGIIEESTGEVSRARAVAVPTNIES
jgi:hypothetical protein